MSHSPVCSLSCFPLLCIPCPVIMSCLNTCASNKDKHPGMVDMSPPRHAPAPSRKKVIDEQTPEDKLAREESCMAGIGKLAEIEEHNAQKLKTLMAPGLKPWPWMVMVVSKTAISTTGGTATPQKGKTAKETTGTGGNQQDDIYQGNGKKMRILRKLQNDQHVIILINHVVAGMVLVCCVAPSSLVCHVKENTVCCTESENCKIGSLHGQQQAGHINAKKDFSGPQTDMRKVQVWMSKIQNPSQQDGGSSASAHSFASHLADIKLVTSTGSQHSQQSVAPNISSGNGLRYRHSSDIAATDNAYRDALVTQPEHAPQDPALAHLMMFALV
ncbi:hypothetical protein EI94DRAFT_1701211 [Lactarius quietus]|nr:hypothetical protein EI94DRAFT_1701211 [Lactarius quietus]